MSNPNDEKCQDRLILRKTTDHEFHTGRNETHADWSPENALASFDDWRAVLLRFLYFGAIHFNLPDKNMKTDNRKLGMLVAEGKSYNLLGTNAKGDQGHATGMCMNNSVFYFFDPLLGEMILPVWSGLESTLHRWLGHPHVVAYFNDAQWVTATRFRPERFDTAKLFAAWKSGRSGRAD